MKMSLRFRKVDFLIPLFTTAIFILKLIKKNITIFVSIFCILFFQLQNNAQANMFNKFKKGFYFEKYDTAKEAQNELLRLYPIGNDVNGLIELIKDSGAILAKEITPKSYLDPKKFESWWKKDMLKIYETKYDDNGYFFTSFIDKIRWTCVIQVDKDEKILDLKVSRIKLWI
jgi:hypothetical protein